MSERRYDPIEDDPAVKPLVETADAKAKAVLATRGRRPGRGYCHLLWREKKRILQAEHGIIWRSPQEMNPDVLFD